MNALIQGTRIHQSQRPVPICRGIGTQAQASRKTGLGIGDNLNAYASKSN